jgi:hypothetical protein
LAIAASDSINSYKEGLRYTTSIKGMSMVIPTVNLHCDHANTLPRIAALLVLGTILVAFIVLPSVSAAAPCFGADPTIVGTPGNDNFPNFLRGTPGNDVIDGLSGNDVIGGEGGDDKICGRSGEDRIVGGDGDDEIAGGSEDDWLIGGKGDDTLRGGSGDDLLDGGEGTNTLDGGDGSDICGNTNGNGTAENCEFVVE